MKNWNNAITQDSWRILKYNAETITGFEKLLEVGPSISILAQQEPNQKICTTKKLLKLLR